MSTRHPPSATCVVFHGVISLGHWDMRRSRMNGQSRQAVWESRQESSSVIALHSRGAYVDEREDKRVREISEYENEWKWNDVRVHLWRCGSARQTAQRAGNYKPWLGAKINQDEYPKTNEIIWILLDNGINLVARCITSVNYFNQYFQRVYIVSLLAGWGLWCTRSLSFYIRHYLFFLLYRELE